MSLTVPGLCGFEFFCLGIGLGLRDSVSVWAGSLNRRWKLRQWRVTVFYPPCRLRIKRKQSEQNAGDMLREAVWIPGGFSVSGSCLSRPCCLLIFGFHEIPPQSVSQSSSLFLFTDVSSEPKRAHSIGRVHGIYLLNKWLTFIHFLRCTIVLLTCTNEPWLN